MKHAIRINEAQFVGATIVTFEDEGKARLVVEALQNSGDTRVTAEYMGKCSTTHLTFGVSGMGVDSLLRTRAMEQYNQALPHREAYDVLDLAVSEDGREASCYVLGGWRK